VVEISSRPQWWATMPIVLVIYSKSSQYCIFCILYIISTYYKKDRPKILKNDNFVDLIIINDEHDIAK
jgi:uncharacterized membrane protein